MVLKKVYNFPGKRISLAGGDKQVRGMLIIIISLFQEDNIFGTNASLTYGPRLQR